MTRENIKQFVKENGYSRYYKLVTTNKAIENAYGEELTECDYKIGSRIPEGENEAVGGGVIVGDLLAKSKYDEILSDSGIGDLFIIEAEGGLVAGVTIEDILQPVYLDEVEEVLSCADEDWEDEE